jgi:hypothetical protein
MIFASDFPLQIICSNHMKSKEIKKAIERKTREFELAMETGAPHTQLKGLYKQLKELQYQFSMTEIKERYPEDVA